MRAIILAAGQSKRLYPLTKDIPKCLLSINNKTILQHQIENLITGGVDEIIIVTGYKQEKIKKHLLEKKYPIKIITINNDNYNSTNAIYSLWLAKDYIYDEIIFCHCDAIFELKVISEIISSPHDAIVAYKEIPCDEESGKLIIGDNHKVIEMSKKIALDKATGEFMQIGKFGKKFNEELVKTLNKNINIEKNYMKFTSDVCNEIIKNEKVDLHAHDLKNLKIMEIDTPEDYEQAKLLFLN